MRNKFLISAICLVVITAVVGCASLSSEKSDEVTLENSSDDELTVKTDWNQMASITFSEDDLTIDGSGCSDEDGILYITEGGAYTLQGTSSSSSVVVNTDENVKLILNGVDLQSVDGPVIYGAQVKNLYIELADGSINTLTDSNEYATDSSTGEEIGKGVISCEDVIIIIGEGTLNINGNHKHGISSDDKLYVESGNINVVTQGTDGFNANDIICIDGGTIVIEAVSDVMESDGVLQINGGEITAKSNDEGLEAKDSIYINGGVIDISVLDDGLNATNYIEINDGDLSITCETGDGVDCNGGVDGCITINGGNIYVQGGKEPEGGIDADNSSVIINGGEVIAIGAVNSPISEESGQVSIVYGSFDADQSITITDENGNQVFEYTPAISGSTMIISSNTFEIGKTYKIISGDNEISVTAETTVVEAGGSAQGMGGHGGSGGQLQKPDGDLTFEDMPDDFAPGQMNPEQRPQGPIDDMENQDKDN